MSADLDSTTPEIGVPESGTTGIAQNPVFPDSAAVVDGRGTIFEPETTWSDANARGGDPLGSPPRIPDPGLTDHPVSRTGSDEGRGYRVVASTPEQVDAAHAFYEEWTKNETPGQKAHAKGRSVVFSLMQYRAHPDTGVTLMTQEQWDAVISELELLGILDRWACIWHDRDQLPDGQPKPLHFHGVIRLTPGSEKQLRYLSIRSKVPASRWRTPKDSYAEGKKVVGPLAADLAFFDFCQYLVHEDERSRDEGKYQYPRDEVRANFDFGAFLDAGRPAKAKNSRSKLSDVDRLALRVQEEGLSLKAARAADPLAFSKGQDRLKRARATYLRYLDPPASRMNYYLGGASETGKSALARLFARMLYPDLPANECYFEVGSEQVAFQAYDGQPVVIWDDYRAVSLLHALKDRGTVWRVFDTSPGSAEVNIKHGSAGMVQAVNIVTGVAPYAEFLDALAGTYKSADGTEHQAEDPTQAWRRFPFVGEVTKEQILLYANRGFTGLGEYRQYQHIITTRANMRTVMQTLDGIADEADREAFRLEMGDRLLGELVSAHHGARPQRSLTLDQARAALDGRVATYAGDELAELQSTEAQVAQAEAHAAAQAAREEVAEVAAWYARRDLHEAASRVAALDRLPDGWDTSKSLPAVPAGLSYDDDPWPVSAPVPAVRFGASQTHSPNT